MLEALLGIIAGALLCFLVIILLANRRPRGMSAFWFPVLKRPHRHIFRYFDGERTRWGDPLEIMRALHCDPEYDIRKHPKRVEAGDLAAVDVTLRAIQRAFGVTLWTAEEPRGLTQSELLLLNRHFAAFMEHLKKKVGRLRLPPLSTDSTPTESIELTIPASSDFWKTSTTKPLDGKTSPERELQLH